MYYIFTFTASAYMDCQCQWAVSSIAIHNARSIIRAITMANSRSIARVNAKSVRRPRYDFLSAFPCISAATVIWLNYNDCYISQCPPCIHHIVWFLSGVAVTIIRCKASHFKIPLSFLTMWMSSLQWTFLMMMQGSRPL